MSNIKNLIDSGRELANVMLAKGIEDAEDGNQMQDHCLILKRMAIHILAIEAFNDQELGGMTYAEFLEGMEALLVEEISLIRKHAKDGNMVLRIPGQKE